MFGAYSMRGTRFSKMPRAVFRMHYIPVVAGQEALFRAQIRGFGLGQPITPTRYVASSLPLHPDHHPRCVGAHHNAPKRV